MKNAISGRPRTFVRRQKSRGCLHHRAHLLRVVAARPHPIQASLPGSDLLGLERLLETGREKLVFSVHGLQATQGAFIGVGQSRRRPARNGVVAAKYERRILRHRDCGLIAKRSTQRPKRAIQPSVSERSDSRGAILKDILAVKM